MFEMKSGSRQTRRECRRACEPCQGPPTTASRARTTSSLHQYHPSSATSQHRDHVSHSTEFGLLTSLSSSSQAKQRRQPVIRCLTPLCDARTVHKPSDQAYVCCSRSSAVAFRDPLTWLASLFYGSLIPVGMSYRSFPHHGQHVGCSRSR